jgi:hypothetical protein
MLVALIVNVFGVVAENVAVRLSVVSVPPAGVTLQSTRPPHVEFMATAAVSVELTPVFTVDGAAVTVTLVIKQLGAIGWESQAV